VAVDSDTLYVLATGISIVSVLVVVVAKYWFGKGEDNDRTAEEENDQAVQGTFGKLPIAEWKQHKSALDQEYRERFMETPNSPKADMDNDEKEPLLSFSPDDDVSDAVDNKTVAKVVRFQDDSGDRRQSDQNDEDDAESIKGQQLPISDEDLKDILNEQMDEEDLAHLPGQLKSVKLRKATKQVEEALTDEQKEEEAVVRGQQLESILMLMRQQEEKFGNSSMEDIQEQLKLYNL